MENDILVQHKIKEVIPIKENPRRVSEGLSAYPSIGLKIAVYTFLAACVIAATIIYSFGGEIIFPLGSFY